MRLSGYFLGFEREMGAWDPNLPNICPKGDSALLRCSTYTNGRKRTKRKYMKLHQVGVRNVSWLFSWLGCASVLAALSPRFAAGMTKLACRSEMEPKMPSDTVPSGPTPHCSGVRHIRTGGNEPSGNISPRFAAGMTKLACRSEMEGVSPHLLLAHRLRLTSWHIASFQARNSERPEECW
jgi:hypothetical protein